MSDSFGVLWQINMIKLKCFVLYAVPMHASILLYLQYILWHITYNIWIDIEKLTTTNVTQNRNTLCALLTIRTEFWIIFMSIYLVSFKDSDL
jgi:hypothetical protein